MPNRVVRRVSLTSLVSVLPYTLFVIVTHPSAIRANYKFITMCLH